MQRTQATNRRDLKRSGGSLKTAVDVIKAYRKSLSVVGARREIIDSLDGALAILESQAAKGAISAVFGSKVIASRDAPDDKDIATLPEPEIEAMINDEDVTRRTLERIAIERFAVPKGSMRSYPNIMLLKEKLRTLMQNDVAHQAISEISKRVS
ncbi:hypothetical protein GCM10009424_31700 [Sphingomonas ursincola]|uniref:Uncharacterized protein n=1 Tax=Sphingomonas ursincola TaxID=56361 RepID=A0A7V8RAW9_9SPHN|nr:hypothetical protein [Sphingomonas ursincola]MBA1373099.1 hypothetical protein [Sphingomonas ursincola]